MREIKFRAWDKRRKKWFNDFHMTSDGVWVVYDSEDGGKQGLWEHDISEDYDLEILQFTGLKDKNGKEIYEGDIVHWPHLTRDLPLVVKYTEAECVFVADTPKGEPDSWLDKTCEVIGNIYENPELITNVSPDQQRRWQNESKKESI